MRRVLVLLHRWFGLFTALFLAIAGLTGAVISWDQELDAYLNPSLYRAESGTTGPARPPLELANRLERAEPRLRVGYVPLAVEPGAALNLFVDGRMDPAVAKGFDLGFNQIALDPATGQVQGKRMWGEVSLSRQNLLPFLYKLHYSLHIPPGFGVELGIWLMGVVAIVWMVDAFIALWISFPSWKSWRKSLAFRLRDGGQKLNFDLHRSGGVWAWLLLLLLAVTAVSMNLEREVVRPLVSVFSTLSPTPFDSRKPNPPDQPIEPMISREQVLERARAEAVLRGLGVPAGGIAYSSEYGLYGVGFFEPGHERGDGGLGNPWLYFDGRDGRALGADIPGTGSAGDIFMQLQFPLHSGRILGVAGRVLVSLLGLLVGMLSVTGIVIWAQKRRARARLKAREQLDAAPPRAASGSKVPLTHVAKSRDERPTSSRFAEPQ
jgi:uncharacterized iron-regulated membrane protein